ncbi:hypothetical protein RCL1_003574 [Eukaryota sp. TZLM3-RCL]
MNVESVRLLLHTQRIIDDNVIELQEMWKNVRSECSSLDKKLDGAVSDLHSFLDTIDSFEQDLDNNWTNISSSIIEVVSKGHSDFIKDIDYIDSSK